jgi:hypothetical protein
MAKQNVFDIQSTRTLKVTKKFKVTTKNVLLTRTEDVNGKIKQLLKQQKYL